MALRRLLLAIILGMNIDEYGISLKSSKDMYFVYEWGLSLGLNKMKPI